METRCIWITLVTAYLNVYSTMFEHKHSQIVVDDSIQTNIQETTTYDEKQESDMQELKHTMTCQKIIQENTA